MISPRGLPLFLLTKRNRGGSFLAVQTLHMKLSTQVTVFFAALLGVSAQAQILTNYGPGDGTNTNGGAYNAANGYPAEAYTGTWDGGSGKSISPSFFAAQTFLTPGVSGLVQLYAYNFQLNVSAPVVANPTFHPTFTAGIYAWTGSGVGSGGNTSLGTKGALVDGTQFSFTPVIGEGFTIYGTNSVTAPGFGSTLDANTIYALVIQRTDTPIGSVAGSVVQYGYDVGGNYVDGQLYTSTAGSSFSQASGQDMAFWASFQAESLSPVPEPAVSGALIGAAFVVGLVTVRRYRNKKASVAQVA